MSPHHALTEQPWWQCRCGHRRDAHLTRNAICERCSCGQFLPRRIQELSPLVRAVAVYLLSDQAGNVEPLDVLAPATAGLIRAAIDAAPAVVEAGDDTPKTVCPRCGASVEDYDGFGVLRHDACGYCAHPSRDGGVCGLCGHAEATAINPDYARENPNWQRTKP